MSYGKDELPSIIVSAGKRTYFIDVKHTKEGAKYLKIAESKLIENGIRERHEIMIFEEDINKIVEALRTALAHFPNYKKSGVINPLPTKSKMEQLKDKFENAYKPWTNEEDILLTKLCSEGKSTDDLSQLFKRNTGAINSRIEKLNLKK